MESAACVEFVEVAKSYGQLSVLQNMSATCPVGAVTAFVGASGSGKTTSLQMVNGLVRPDSGMVRVFGEAVPTQGIEQFRRQIGYAVQGAGLFPHLSAFANISLVARLEGWSEERMRERASALMQQMNLPLSAAERLPRDLSGGQQQRIGLCRALMLEPQLLLLDEPFSAVDPITRSELYDHFDRVVHDSGVSALLVTHDLREARRLADHLVILEGGVIRQSGPVQDVLQNPTHPYVRRLVESQLQ